MVKLNHIFLLFFILSIVTIKSKIVPDKQFPLQVTNPHFSTNSDFILKFSINSLNTSGGLQYGNYIMIKFPLLTVNPISIGVRKEDGSLQYSCSLYDKDNVTYKLSANTPIELGANIDSYEPNLAFCEFTDQTRNIPLNTPLTLVISLDYNFTPHHILHNIGLFFVTSMSKNRIIFDYLPAIGNIFLYNDISSSNLLSITDSSIISTDRPDCTSDCIIYPYESLSITLDLKAEALIPLQSYAMLIIQIDARFLNISDNLEITTQKMSDDVLGQPLQKANNDISIGIFNDFYTEQKVDSSMGYVNSLHMKSGNSGSIMSDKAQYLVSNIGENLIAGRTFRLKLNQVKANDIILNLESVIEVLIIQKNSFTILSYANSIPFKISPLLIRNHTASTDNTFSGISHPEFTNIYQNSAWPIKFRFSVTKQNIAKPVWVVINHANRGNSCKFNFIASTCDFSDIFNKKTTVENELSKRPICYPLRNDFSFKNKAITDHEGSGVFFKLGNIIKDTPIVVTIWGYADVCGVNQLQTVNSAIKYPNPLGNDSSNSMTSIKFNIYVYTGINSNNVNSENFKNNNIISSMLKMGSFNNDNNSRKFSDNLKNYNSFTLLTTGDYRFVGQNIIAQATDIEMYGKCYGNVISGNSKVTNFSDLYNQVTLTPNNKNGDDILMFKEFTDFNLGSHSSEAECSDCYMTNVINKDFSDSFNFYLYSSDSAVIEPFLGIKTNINIAKYSTPADYIPLPLYKKANNYYNQQGQIEIILTSPFYGTGTPNCLLSWGSKSLRTNPLITQKNLFSSSLNNNFIVKNGASAANTILEVLSVDPGYSDATFTIRNPNKRIKSKILVVSVDSQFPSDFALFADALKPEIRPEGALDDNDIFSLHLYTTCFKYKYLTSIRSIYTYFELMVNWRIASVKEDVNRVLRFIKLYPEVGVFTSNSSDLKETFSSNINVFNFHFGYSSKSAFIDNPGLCILEVMDVAIKGTGSIGLFIHDITFLDTDFTSIVSTYPAGPIVSGNVFLFNSAYSRSNSNFLYNTVNSKNYYNEYYSTSTKNTQTAYHHYLTPFILISGFKDGKITSTQTTQVSLLIPVYCPSTDDNSVGSNYPSLDIRVTIVYFSAFVSSHNSIPTIAKLGVQNNIYNIKISKDPSISTTSSNLAKASLRFKPYSLIGTANNTPLYLLNGSRTIAGSDSKCTGFILMFNDQVAEDSTTTISLNYSVDSVATKKDFIKVVNNFNSSSDFYAYGIRFSRIRLLSNVTEITIPSSTTGANSPFTLESNPNFSISGILRPSVDIVNSNTNIESIYNSNSFNFNSLYGKNGLSAFNSPSSIINSSLKNDLNTNFNIGLSNLIAFSCSSSISTTNNILTNFILKETASFSYKYFLIDFASDNTKWDFKILNETDSDFFKLDKAGAVRFSLKVPGNFPYGSVINISSASFQLETMCGYMMNNMYSLSCINNDGVKISCHMKNGSYQNTQFTICCYNVNTSEDPFSISGLSLDYSINNTITELSYIRLLNPDIVDSNSNPIYFSITKQNTAVSLADSNVNFGSEITGIFYSQSNHVDGLGVAWIKIDMKRRPLPGMVLSIQGKFSALNLGLSKTNCSFTYSDPSNDPSYVYKNNFTAKNVSNSIDHLVKKPTYGTDYEKGDLFVDNCTIGNLNLTENIVYLNHKKIIHKCGLSTLSKTLYFKLWPVKVADWNIDSLKSLTFKLIAVVGEIPVLNTKTSVIPLTQDLIPNLPSSDQKERPIQLETLCPLITITPKLNQASASFIFSFDTITNLKTFNYFFLPLNEVTIFWDLSKYRFLPTLYCTNKNIIINCDIDNSTGVMNIYLENNLELSKLNLIEVVGVIVPEIIASSNSSPNLISDEFPCSINNVTLDLTTNIFRRLNGIVGSGKVTSSDAINPYIKSSIDSNNGGLLFHVLPNYVDKLLYLPRESETLLLRITLDPISNILPKTLVAPIFIIELPIQYCQYLTTDKIIVTFKLFDYDKNNNPVEVKDGTNSVIVAKSITIKNNTVVVDIISASVTLTKNFAFIEIFTTVINPRESTDILNNILDIEYNEVLVSDNTPNQNTNDVNITITNKDSSIMLRTFTNINNFIFVEKPNSILGNKVLPMIQYLKGLYYNYSLTLNRLSIDFKTEKSIDKNILVIKAGRYTRVTATLNSIPTIKNYLVTGLLQVDSTDSVINRKSLFRTDQSSYLIDNVSNNNVIILLGSRCSIFKSKYFLKFSISDPAADVNSPPDFYSLLPIQVIIDKTPGELVLYKSPLFTDENKITDIPIEGMKNGSLYIYFLLSDYVFDDLTVQLKNVSDIESKEISFSLGQVSNLKNRGYATLRNNPTTTFASQKFKIDRTNVNAANPLNCFSSIVDSFEINLVNVITPIKFDKIQDSFAYLTSSNDNTLLFNELLFVYTPKFANSFMFCNLICNTMNFPSDSIIVDHLNYVNTTQSQFISLYMDSKSPTDYPIKFSNLIRGNRYKLKCIISNTDSNRTKADNRTVEFNVFNNLTQATLNGIIIQPKPVEPVQCIKYEFDSEPVLELQNNIMKIFQYQFLKYGLNDAGCVYALDKYNKTFDNMKIPNTESCLPNFKKSIYDEVNNNNSDDDDFEGLRYLIQSNEQNITEVVNGIDYVHNYYSSYNNLRTDKTSNHIRKLQADGVVSSSVSTLQYTVCGVIPKNYGSDVNSNKLNKDTSSNTIVSYSDVIKEILNLAKDSIAFKDTYSTTTNSFQQASIIVEDSKIDMGLLIIDKFILNSTYHLTFIASYKDDLVCYYRIQLKQIKEEPSLSQMICDKTDSLICGLFYVNSQGYVNNIDLSGNSLLVKYYNFYVVCFYDLPGASLPSPIKLMKNFAYSLQPLCEENCTNTNSSASNNSSKLNITVCDTDNSSMPCDLSSRVTKISYILVMILIFLLFF